MLTIDYNENEFTVDGNVKDFGEEIGKYRVIRYNTGYYALQRSNYQEDDNEAWETVVISPYLDNVFNTDYNWAFSQGRLTMKSLLTVLEDSYKLQNNELMELHLSLNPNMEDDTKEKIVHVIKTETGKSIEEKVLKSLKIQDESFQEYLLKETRENRIIRICTVIALIVLIGITLHSLGLI